MLNLLKDGELVGLGVEVFPSLGHFLIADQLGVGLACLMMMQSLKSGKSTNHIQYETLWKARSYHANYLHASCHGTGATFMSEDGNGLRVSYAVTNPI